MHQTAELGRGGPPPPPPRFFPQKKTPGPSTGPAVCPLGDDWLLAVAGAKRRQQLPAAGSRRRAAGRPAVARNPASAGQARSATGRPLPAERAGAAPALAAGATSLTRSVQAAAAGSSIFGLPQAGPRRPGWWPPPITPPAEAVPPLLQCSRVAARSTGPLKTQSASMRPSRPKQFGWFSSRRRLLGGASPRAMRAAGPATLATGQYRAGEELASIAQPPLATSSKGQGFEPRFRSSRPDSPHQPG